MQHWAIELSGHSFDAADWAEVLKSPFDPWGEQSGETFILRWSGFDGVATAEEVYESASPIIDQLNGAMSIAKDSQAMRMTGVVEFSADRTRLGTVKFATGYAEGRSRVTANGVIVRADGTIVPPPPPQASEVQQWLRLSDTHEILADALVYFSRAEWFDVYKAIECLMTFVGGEAALRELNWIDPAKFGDLKQTANSLDTARANLHRPGTR